MKINNKKGFILIPLMAMVLIFILLIFLNVKFKFASTLTKNEQTYNSIISNIDSGKQDLLTKQKEGIQISNPAELVLGQETYDDGTVNLYNVIDGIASTNDINSDKIQFIDKIITSKTSEFKLINENLPSKNNNVFEIELTDFIDNDGNLSGDLSNLKLEYGTNINNAPPFYLILSRIKKNATIDINDDYLIDLSQKQAGNAIFGKTNTDLDNFAFDYRKLGTGNFCFGNVDTDYGFSWCKSQTINDFLSNSNFDTSRYFYKMFIIFGFQDGNDANTPFRLTSSDGVFGLGNIDNLDVTLLTPNNAKRRIVIKAANKNNVLPYLVYSLWVKGEVEMMGNDS